VTDIKTADIIISIVVPVYGPVSLISNILDVHL